MFRSGEHGKPIHQQTEGAFLTPFFNPGRLYHFHHPGIDIDFIVALKRVDCPVEGSYFRPIPQIAWVLFTPFHIANPYIIPKFAHNPVWNPDPTTQPSALLFPTPSPTFNIAMIFCVSVVGH